MSALPENLLKMQVIRSSQEVLNQILGWDPAISVLSSPVGSLMLTFEDHCHPRGSRLLDVKFILCVSVCCDIYPRVTMPGPIY